MLNEECNWVSEVLKPSIFLLMQTMVFGFSGRIEESDDDDDDDRSIDDS